MSSNLRHSSLDEAAQLDGGGVRASSSDQANQNIAVVNGGTPTAIRPAKEGFTKDNENVDDLLDEIENSGTKDQEMVSLQAQLGALMTEFTKVQKDLDDQEEQLKGQRELMQKLVANVSQIQSITGGRCQHVWKIDNFRQKLQKAAGGNKNNAMYSQPFQTHQYGYKLALTLCPFGEGEVRSEFMSLYFCILKTEYDVLLRWPFSANITFSLLDTKMKPEERRHINKRMVVEPNRNNLKYLTRPVANRNPSLGILQFAKLSDIFEPTNNYLRNDTMYVRVIVDLDDIVAI